MALSRVLPHFVYKIECRNNGKIYIGITSLPPAKRFEQHLAGSRKQSSLRLAQAIRKHGAEAFVLTVLEQELSHKKAIEAECRYIAQFQSTLFSNGYNMTNGGEGNPFGGLTPEGKEKSRNKVRASWTEERREKHRAALKKYWETPGRRETFSQLMLNKMKDPAVRQRILDGIAASPEQARQELSARVRKMWADPAKRASVVEKMKKNHIERRKAWEAWKAQKALASG
jgi:group I intron endonuclease